MCLHSFVSSLACEYDVMSCPELLPLWVPAVMACDLELWDNMNPFSSLVALGQGILSQRQK